MFRQPSPSSDEDMMMDRIAPAYLAAGPCRSSHQRQNKGHLWLESEHEQFVAGLAKLGRGNWRDISRWFVPSRTPTQVASHAQKYFMRMSGVAKKRSRFSSLSEPKNPTAPISPSSQQDSQPSESNSPASTTVTTTSSDATAPQPAPPAAAAAATPSCPPTAPCLSAPSSAPTAAASPLPAGRQLGVPVFLPGPGGLPMVLTYPTGCCAPMVTPFSPWTFSMHMVAGPASKKAGGTAADLGIWPSPMMLHAMTAMQQQQQTMAAAVEAAAAMATPARPAAKRPRPPPYTLPAGVRKPAVVAAAKGCSAALLEAVLASVCPKPGACSLSVAASLGSAFRRPVAASLGIQA